ncbi:hypothetical protein Tco_1255853 [Tanacetum coccineum]
MMMSQNRSIHARKNSAQPHVVITNNDLLTEILIRLPILCIHLFTTVSKQWLRILSSLDFTPNHSKILNLDPPAGLFVNHLRSLFECDFVSLDSRLDSSKSTMNNSFGSAEEVDHVRILQSCNGLLLCTGLACLDDIGSREYTIYKMMKGYSVWTVMYLVSTDEFMTLFPEGWSIRFTVWSLGLGEREEEYFLVINLSGKVVKYNLISKTINEIDIGSNQMDDDDEFIPPYTFDHNPL